MPGPKMGDRPVDFDEEVVRQSPTFLKWLTLETGQKLRYACRDFTKGHGEDEERLMRRIMIARRNNLKDHETLKRARCQQSTPPAAASGAPDANEGTIPPVPDQDLVAASAPVHHKSRKRRLNGGLTDTQVMREMDVAAVEATRSYRAWVALEEGKEFVYNQKYIRGKEHHDWLLRKNIWRRMRYRRENKRMVERLRGACAPDNPNVVEADCISAAAGIVDHALEADFVNKAVVEAAVAAAESYVKGTNAVATAAAMNAVHNPLEAPPCSNEALDAAAKLAAAAVVVDEVAHHQQVEHQQQGQQLEQHNVIDV